jgi:tetratricopeptide (TPR) repeat protein
MKRTTLAASMAALASVGIAGWQVCAWYADRQPPGRPPGTLRVASPPATPAPPPLPPLVRPATFFLRTLPRRPAAAMTDADWAAAYPAFGHAPFGEAGFAAVALPWRFAATPDAGPATPGGPADPAVAHALAFLLSYDLDWSPASYGVAHAYFVFRRSRDLLAGPAAAAYDPARVGALVRGWGGTHAVGGALVRGKDGYVATLQVFDRDGRQVHEADFERTQDFFGVLGDVSADALRFLGGAAVPDPLAAHLRRRRCERPGSLAAVGAAAFADERSGAGALDRVLAADPGFVEVRQWRAAERWFADGDAAARAGDLAAGLGRSVHVAALADFRPDDCSPPPPADRVAGWVDAAEALAGRDHPVVVAWRLRQSAPLRNGRAGAALTREAFRPFVEAGGRHPNHRGLSTALLDAMAAAEHEPALAPYDPELVASLAVAAAGSRVPAADGNAAAWARVAESARALNRPDHVLAAAERARKGSPTFAQSTSCEFWAADADMHLGRFDEAARAFARLARSRASDGWREQAADKAAVCAILAGRPDDVDRLASDPGACAGRAADFLAGCGKYLAGEPVGAGDFPSQYNWHAEDLLLAEAELAQGGDFARADRPRVWSAWVNTAYARVDDRLRWALLEQYYRRQPSLPHRAGFYEAAGWQFPDDPLVAAAVADWRRAGGGPDLPAADRVVADAARRTWTKDEKMPVWAGVARVRRELEEGRPDEARRVLAAVREGFPSHRALISSAARRVEQETGATDRAR